MSDSTSNPPPDDSRFTPPPSERPTTPPAGGYAPTGGQPGYPSAPPPGPGYGPGYGYGPGPTGPGAPAELMPRFLARLIDYAVLFIVYIVIAVISSVDNMARVRSGNYDLGHSFLTGALVSIVLTAVYVGYFTLLESHNGATLGKMALKLRTEGPDGSNPTLEQALKRNLFNATLILGVIPILGSFLNAVLWLIAIIVIAVQINGSPTRQAWHDKLAGGTRVVTTG